MLFELKRPCSNCPNQLPFPRCRKLCVSFIDLPFIGKSGKGCPCNQIGKEAILRSCLAIEEWDNGTHKWQKENNGEVS